MKTIVLLNLNSYLGGGEVLVVRLAEQLKLKGQPYKVICLWDSYIHKECIKNQLQWECWPISNDSILYMNRKEKKRVFLFMEQTLSGIENPFVYTFCFRDVYNVLYLKGKIQKKLYIGTGIYHPDDTKYVATRTIYAKRNRDINRCILQQYCDNNSAVFMSERCHESSCVAGDDYPLIPLPITKAKTYDTIRQEKHKKILWIGRLVGFKLPAIMEIIRFVEVNPYYSLTILGYGTEEKRIKGYIRKKRLKNVTLIGKTDPAKLPDIIRSNDIGYVMGTSILECAAWGIPVVKAAIMPRKMAAKRNDICIGIFGEVRNYDMGEVDLTDKSAVYSLRDCIEKIQNNYDAYCRMTNQFVKEFDIQAIIDKYIKLWEYSEFLLNDMSVEFPHISGIRFFLKRVLYKKILLRLNN